VYTRSPSAFEALKGLKILQLPCSKVLKRFLKEGAEQSGIDEDYFMAQEQKYTEFQNKRENEGAPRPLRLGVLMWDEVKVCHE